MQHTPVGMKTLIKRTSQKAVYEIWKKQEKRKMTKCLLIPLYTAFLFFVQCYARAPPFSILKTYKIGKEKAKDGRKRKILYWIEGTNL